jgi:hypothetical protein
MDHNKTETATRYRELCGLLPDRRHDEADGFRAYCDIDGNISIVTKDGAKIPHPFPPPPPEPLPVLKGGFPPGSFLIWLIVASVAAMFYGVYLWL